MIATAVAWFVGGECLLRIVSVYKVEVALKYLSYICEVRTPELAFFFAVCLFVVCCAIKRSPDDGSTTSLSAPSGVCGPSSILSKHCSNDNRYQ